MGKAFTAGVLVHVHITVLDLDFNGLTDAVAEKNEIFLTSSTANFVGIVVQTVFDLDLGIALFEFLGVTEIGEIHCSSRSRECILNTRNGRFSWFEICSFGGWGGVLRKFVFLTLWWGQSAKNSCCCKSSRISVYLLQFSANPIHNSNVHLQTHIY